MAVGHGLAPAERVRRRPDFERAYAAGARMHGRFITLLVVSATRKIGSAVQRNRAKRLAREVFRRHKTTLGLDIIIVARREMLDASFTSLEADYLATLRKHDPHKPPSPQRPRSRSSRP